MSLALIKHDETPDQKRVRYVNNINAHYRETVTSIMAMGDWLKDAIETFDPDQYSKMFGKGDDKLPFDQPTARKLRLIAAAKHVRAKLHALPACYTTLYELTKLQVETFEEVYNQGKITPSPRVRTNITLAITAL